MDTSRFHRPAPQTAVWFSSTDLAYANKPSRSAENRTPSTHVRGLCMQSHRSTLRREARGAYTLSGYREVEVKERGPSGCWLSCSSRPAVARQQTWCAAGFGSSLVANPGCGSTSSMARRREVFHSRGDCREHIGGLRPTETVALVITPQQAEEPSLFRGTLPLRRHL